MLKQFLLRWLVNFLGLWIAANLVTGITYGDKVRYLVFAALIFSIVNALIRPLVIILALPAIVLTLGLFTLVVNTLMLYLVTVFYHPFHVNSFWAGLLAVIVIWLVNYLLNDLRQPNLEKHEKPV
ncbi:MAG TPA: phage holin family protein [Candidatus Saccharimonadales bacterium]|nr:phage holin family protein [Candidatus Saccharimonadales bacterium]